MSEAENKTEKKIETGTDDTVPNMKNDNKPESSNSESTKSNFVIPLVLLLVSAIVIIATFYEDEYKDLIANNTGSQEDKVDTAVTTANSTEVITSTAIDDNTSSTEIVAEKSSENLTPETQAVAVTKQNNSVVNTETSSNTKTIATSAVVENKVKQQYAFNNYSHKRPAYAPYQDNPKPLSYEQVRQQATAHAREQQKKHNEMMQQRRQAYEKEMELRQQQHEALKKAEQERRAIITETQKAVFESIEKTRIETNQKIQEMHKRISDMHKELHQKMRDSGSRTTTEDNSASQVQNI